MKKKKIDVTFGRVVNLCRYKKEEYVLPIHNAHGKEL